MATSTWVYRQSDGLYLYGGFYQPTFDPVTQGSDTFPDAAPHPDPRLQRHDAVKGGTRLATVSEIAAYDAMTHARLADPAGDKLILAVLLTILQYINTLRAASTPPLPPLTLTQVKTDILTMFNTLG